MNWNAVRGCGLWALGGVALGSVAFLVAGMRDQTSAQEKPKGAGSNVGELVAKAFFSDGQAVHVRGTYWNDYYRQWTRGGFLCSGYVDYSKSCRFGQVPVRVVAVDPADSFYRCYGEVDLKRISPEKVIRYSTIGGGI